MRATLSLPSIPKSTRDSFRSILALPDKKLTALGSWVNSNIETLSSGEMDRLDPQSIANELGVTRSDVIAVISLAMTLLHSIEGQAAIIGDLGLTDLDARIKLLLAPINVPLRDLEYSRQKGLAFRSAIPTLEDVDALCDLRAVFRRLPSGSSSESHTSKVNELLGFEPVAIIGLELNDSSGNDKPYVFQVSEQGLRNLIKTLEETLAQMEIVRRVKPMATTPLTSSKQ